MSFLDLFQGFYFWLYYVVYPFEALDFVYLSISVLIYHVHKSGFLGFVGNHFICESAERTCYIFEGLKFFSFHFCSVRMPFIPGSFCGNVLVAVLKFSF